MSRGPSRSSRKATGGPAAGPAARIAIPKRPSISRKDRHQGARHAHKAEMVPRPFRSADARKTTNHPDQSNEVRLVPQAGLEPARLAATDFESAASTIPP